MSNITISLREFSQGAVWRSEYRQVNPSPYLSRQWTRNTDDRPAFNILHLLPPHQLPHLPMGYIWSLENRELMLLKHACAPSVDFQIILFGPDHRNRIQYLVIQDKQVPLHGFTMTRQEGFPKDLRSEYPASVKRDPFISAATDSRYWRGHIIDYVDTLGHPTQRTQISTLFAPNYKPEPEGAWARTLRGTLAKRIRKIEGSYSEIMIYSPQSDRTPGNKPIPEAVGFSTYLPDQQPIAFYYVPKHHPCHQWTGAVSRRLDELQKGISPFPLIWTGIKADESAPLINANLNSISPFAAWRLKRGAEMELSATKKLQAALYAATHQEPLQEVAYWVSRAARTSLQMCFIFRSQNPPFPQCLANRLPSIQTLHPQLTEPVQQLQWVARTIHIAITSKILLHPLNAAMSFAPRNKARMDAPAIQAPPAVLAPIAEIEETKEPEIPAARVIVTATTIFCVSPASNQYGRMLERIYEAIDRRSPLCLQDVTTQCANQIFPLIQQRAPQGHAPVQSVQVSCERWKTRVRLLTTQYFHLEIIE